MGDDFPKARQPGGTGADGYLGGCDGLETRLSTMREVAGDFDGVGRAAKVRIHPVGACREQWGGGVCAWEGAQGLVLRGPPTL